MPQQMDDELLQQAQAGEESAIAALITAMMPAIRKGAAAVAAPGLDFDDAVQEGLIGLFHAVRSYRADKKVPFTAYAAACIANAQQDARRSATRKKHAPLNNSVPCRKILPRRGRKSLPLPTSAAPPCWNASTRSFRPWNAAVCLPVWRGTPPPRQPNCCTAPPKRWKTP